VLQHLDGATHTYNVCDARDLRGDSGTLGFNQHKIAVAAGRNKEQRQEHGIATTTGRPAQHST